MVRRKRRSRKRCVICGRPIRTGRKYCYEHRGNKTEPQSFEAILRNRSRHAQPGINKLLGHPLGAILIFVVLGGISFSLQAVAIGIFLMCMAGLVAFVFFRARYQKQIKTNLNYERDIKVGVIIIGISIIISGILFMQAILIIMGIILLALFILFQQKKRSRKLMKKIN